jgi:hypothetical protein
MGEVDSHEERSPDPSLSQALDQADPDAETIAALLDAIPGAWEGAQEGLADASAGRVFPLQALGPTLPLFDSGQPDLAAHVDEDLEGFGDS